MIAQNIENIESANNFHSILEDLEEKNLSLCTQLQERLISLTASVKSLKKNVSEEKELWKSELKETIELQKKLSESSWQDCLPHDDYNRQLEMLTTAVLKSQALKSAQSHKNIELSIYRQRIVEAENMCNWEMLKIQNSLECLVPLQAIIDDWNSNTLDNSEVDIIDKDNRSRSSAEMKGSDDETLS